MDADYKTEQILGIPFYNDSLERALSIAHNEGGLFLAPSGPGLSELGKNPHYDRALQDSDINLIDSGFLALLWRKQTGQILQRHSGHKFISALLKDQGFKANANQLWVMPNEKDIQITADYLNRNAISLGADNFYEAPYYTAPDVTDEALLTKIREQRPKYIILAIAGGKQEVLGHWLRQQLDYCPAIICIGAAIAFLTGQQANIPVWADRIYVGWLLRILQDPKTFFPRYWNAFKLRKLLAKYGTAFPAEGAGSHLSK